MDSQTYSDLPIHRYKLDLGGAACEVATLIQMGVTDYPPYWNFFWLSNPTIDRVPDAGKDWWRVYTPTSRLLTSVIKDVSDDFLLHHALSLHPTGFLEWWSEQKHSEFRTYEVAGGQHWVDLVTRRAEAASDRMLSQYPPVVRAGNVLVLADYRARA